MIQKVNLINNHQKFKHTKNTNMAFSSETATAPGNTDLTVKQGLARDIISGNLNGKVFEIEVKEGLNKRKLSGKFNGKNFEIIDSRKKITGIFNGKIVDINIERKNIFSANTKFIGKIGDIPLCFNIESDVTRRDITGKYGDKEIKVDISSGLTKDSMIGSYDDKKIHLYFKDKGLIKNGQDINGDFEAPDELFLILLSNYYDNLNETNSAILLI